jgi:ribulose-5-phosphate 4-epimerase/fuculose-1-phosphate aldolase
MSEIAERAGISKEEDWSHRRKLAVMCRMIGMQGSIGTFGHISLRIPKTDLVLITPGAGTDKTEVRADQIFVYDINGKILFHPGGDRPMTIPAEYRIHTQIHRDRPEIMGVAHLHSQWSTLLGVVNRPIVPAFNQGFMFGGGVPTWDNPALVLNDEMAASLSKSLGDKLAVQMRGHGSVVVGETAESCFMNSTAIEDNAKLQVMAEPFGGPVAFAQEHIDRAMQTRGMLEVAKAMWRFWEHKVESQGIPL